MTRRALILGGGTGGTLVANRLRRTQSASDLEIVVVDTDDRHLYQPGLLFIPFGLGSLEKITRSRREQLSAGISFRQDEVDRVETSTNQVHFVGGESLGYDVLVVASGCVLQPEETDGLTGPGWMERVFSFYSPEGAVALRDRLASFDAGRIVVNVVDLPIKCAVAPLEFCFLADWFFTKRGVRDQIEIVYVTPLDGAFTKPVAAKALAGLLDEKGIQLVTEFNTGEVDGLGGRLVAYDGSEQQFDLAVVVPLHGGAPFVGRSPGLGDELGFMVVDDHTLQSVASPNVFAIGDAAGVPASKAGSVAHFEGEVLVENLTRFLAGEALNASFDGHTNCFIETGFDKALLIDFNYDTEPLPGHYPAALGLPLLKESRLNHLGKLGFQWAYWHSLLPGRDIPGVGSEMPQRGKQLRSRS